MAGETSAIGGFEGDPRLPIDSPTRLRGVIERLERPFGVVEHDECLWAVEGGRHSFVGPGALAAFVAALPPTNLGDPAFLAAHGLRLPYVAGAMANGIASVELVEAMGRAGMLGVFGAAGLVPSSVEGAIASLSERLPAESGHRWATNLIHSPYEPALEEAVARLYVRRGVPLVEASAWLDLGLPLLRYRLAGIREDPSGRVIAPHRIIAKVSRVEVARKFMAPAPDKLLAVLVSEGSITESQARMAKRIPVATDVTVEADSGGHTDNRPLVTLLPSMLALRDRMMAEHRYEEAIRVGAAGGISTPWATAAAFTMGAAYVVTGTINQGCRESGSSDAVRKMLAEAEQADVIMAPAADMFEMGVKLQVLKRGTMFAMRAQKLWEVYRAHESMAAIAPDLRAQLERAIFRTSFDEVWQQCERFFAERDPAQLARAAAEPKHRMALCFRWYLGQSSRWANQGVADRVLDYQVWCGPAMGAFNEWVQGTFLHGFEERRVVTLAHNLLHGAAMVLRNQSLRSQLGRRAHLVPELDSSPRTDDELEGHFS